MHKSYTSKLAHATYCMLQPIRQHGDESGPRPEFEASPLNSGPLGGHASKKSGQRPPRHRAIWAAKQTSTNICLACAKRTKKDKEEKERRDERRRGPRRC